MGGHRTVLQFSGRRVLPDRPIQFNALGRTSSDRGHRLLACGRTLRTASGQDVVDQRPSNVADPALYAERHAVALDQYAALPEIYVQNASLEIAWSRVVLDGGFNRGNVIAPFLTHSSEGVDVNAEADWWYAEYLVENEKAGLPNISLSPYTESP